MRKTNIELITSIMEHSNYGGLAQAFVIDAVGKFAAAVSTSTPADYPEHCVVCPESWIGVAKEIKRKLAAEGKA